MVRVKAVEAVGSDRRRNAADLKFIVG